MSDHPTVGALALAAPQPAIARLTCHAPHTDPKKKGQQCGGLLGDVPGGYEFITTAAKAPHSPDGYVWLRCPSGRCGRWNKFRLQPSGADAVDVRSVEARFSRLPENRQQALLALAGGLSVCRTARSVGVDRRTLLRWSKDTEFAELRQILAPMVSAAHVRTALEAFFDVIEKDRKDGHGHNIRWFLSRTVFADFERSRAMARGSSVSVGVSMTQHQERVESGIKGVWEVRQREKPTALAPEG